MNGNIVTYFDSFGVGNIPKEIKRFIGNKKIITNIYRIEAYDSVICRYFYIGLIGFRFDRFFLPNKFKKMIIMK